MVIFEIICIIFTIIIVFNILVLIKNGNTFRNHKIILYAIYDYAVDQDKKGEAYSVYFDDMEEYDTTLLRWWDWGYKNILPRDKFKIIEPYIRKERNK